MKAGLSIASWACLFSHISAQAVLSSNGYQVCQSGGDVKVDSLAATYDKATRNLSFDVTGSSSKTQNVTALLTVIAYGQQVYENSFNPCETGIKQLCPVPATNFSAHGNQTIPERYASQIPSIAFTIPDLDGLVRLQIMQAGTNKSVACIQASVTNGKTVQLPSVQYVGVGVAGVALVSTGVAAVLSAGHPGAPAGMSPTFGEMIGWFQAMAMNGMLSVNYPPVYQSFAGNFGFSTGLVAWPSLQRTIDKMRAATGGNLTTDSYDYLKTATLVYPDGSINRTSSLWKRSAGGLRGFISTRDSTSFSLNDTSLGTVSGAQTNGTSTLENNHFVSGIQAYAEQLMIPKSNTFMTLLLVFAIVVAGLIAVILLFKIILELWSLMRPLPNSLESWRNRYWWRLAKAITGLVVILYGIWTMYCIYQFTNGDSWVAKLLAGISLGLFTILLGGFITRIIYKARQFKKQHGKVDMLYEDKETWITYSLFYDGFRRTYWWMFIPLIIGACARGAIIAGANGHGAVQTMGHLAIDVALLILLCWTRPYQNKSSNIINIVIQVVRVLSIACILIFVESFGISQTAKTVAGLALIVTQAVLTGLLAILLAVNALIFCIRENPERRKRKQAEKKNNRAPDDLTALDAHNSLLIRELPPLNSKWKVPIISPLFSPTFGDKRGTYDRLRDKDCSPPSYHPNASGDMGYYDPDKSRERLPANAAPMAQNWDADRSSYLR